MSLANLWLEYKMKEQNIALTSMFPIFATINKVASISKKLINPPHTVGVRASIGFAVISCTRTSLSALAAHQTKQHTNSYSLKCKLQR